MFMRWKQFEANLRFGRSSLNVNFPSQNGRLKIQLFIVSLVTRSDPLFLLLEVAAVETAFCCALMASVLAWDWHFGLPFTVTHPWIAGAFCVSTLFGLGPMIGTAVSWCAAALVLLCFMSGDQNHVHLLLALFGAHAALTSVFGFPQSPEWWFANTLGFVLTSVLSGSWKLLHRSVNFFDHV
jgi:hypothetical protein